MFEELKTTLKMSGVYKLSPARRTKLKARLKEYAPQDVLRAAVGLSRSEWHMGSNPSQKKYGTPDFLLRSYEQVERFLNEPINGASQSVATTNDEMEEARKKLEEGVVYASR